MLCWLWNDNQNEAREKMKLLKLLPVDVYHELVEAFMQALQILLDYLYESWRRWHQRKELLMMDRVGRHSIGQNSFFHILKGMNVHT